MKRVIQILRKYGVLLIINAFVIILKLTQCMKIYDDLNVANYCTDQQGMCAEANNSTHIVCEYYGKIALSCLKFEEVPLDESNAKDIIMKINRECLVQVYRNLMAPGENKICSVNYRGYWIKRTCYDIYILTAVVNYNSLRSNIATGIVMGKGQKLPRGYGLMRVSWDSELASFAKIMIKQCLTKHKYSCAATDYFGNPMMIYMYSNASSSAVAIINDIFSGWNATALQVSLEDIQHCPDLKIKGKSGFIKLVMGNVTNVGCALGIYKHDGQDNTQPSGHIICYLSHHARLGAQVYNTTQPAASMGWSKCGCPPTLRETANCLCVGLPKTPRHKNISLTSTRIVTTPSLPPPQMQQQVTTTEKPKSTLEQELEPRYQSLELAQRMVKMIPQQQPITQSTLKQETSVFSIGTPAPICHDKGKCEPQIIMLPIFTIQNAVKGQSNKGQSDGRRFGNFTSLRTVKAIANDDYNNYSDENEVMPKNMSLRSKLLWTLRKIRKNPNIHFFSYEENVELNQSIKAEDHHNLTTEFSDSREEKTKKVMQLLDLLEKKGGNAQFNSEEIMEFDAKMRRVYKAFIATNRRQDSGEMQF